MIDPATLESWFGDEAGLQVWYDVEEFARLPDGGFLNHCTSGALYIQSVLGEGEIYGWFEGTNPDRHPKILGGHDFLVYRDRWIIDPWLSVYRGIARKTVWDLHTEFELIRQYYGDPETWVVLTPEGFVKIKRKWE